MYRLMRKALPWAYLVAVLVGALYAGGNYLFSISVFLLLAGTVVDFLYGKEIERRGAFHVVLVVLYAIVIVTTPRCSTSNPSADQTGLSDPY